MEKEKEEKKEKRKNNAFTLIELLAVITIIAILMVIAIPAVSRIIHNSKRNVYANTAKTITQEARKRITSGELKVNEQNTTYYVPIEYIELEKEMKSPFGEFTDGYIVITFDGKKYHLYWTSTDTANIGIVLTPYTKITKEKVLLNVTDISTDISICGNDRIVIFNKYGNIVEEKRGSSCYNGETNEMQTYKLLKTIEQKTEGVLTAGDEIVIENKEHFYVISSNEDKTVLLAKYNLYVGYNIKSNANGSGYVLDGQISPNDSNYGWQSEVTQTNRNIALVPFSGKKYWQSTTNENFFDDKYQNAREKSVYNSSLSTIAPNVTNKPNTANYYMPTVEESDYTIAYYVKPYVKKIESLGIYVYEGNILSNEQASSVGCGYGSSCRYSWIKNTKFWSSSVAWMGQPSYQNQIIVIFGGYEFGTYNTATAGVRPTITVKTSDIVLQDHEYFENKPIIIN